MKLPALSPAALLLLLPAAILFLLLLVLPLAYLVRVSLLPPGPSAPLSGPLSVGSYASLADSYVLNILLRTVRVSALVTLVSLILGYPLAISLARSSGA